MIEQLGFVLQDVHTGTCELRTPCAVDVANAPLEAASVVRFLSDHALSAPHIGSDWPSFTQGDYSTALIGGRDAGDNTTDPVRNVHCAWCQQSIDNRTNQSNAANHWVLFFLFALFAVHSLAEGLGLGASVCSLVPERQTQIRTVALAILLHKSLSAFAVGAALIRTEIRKSLFGILAVLFSAVTPAGKRKGSSYYYVNVLFDYVVAGALGGWFICRQSKLEHSYATTGLNLIAGGTFLFVSLVEFLPKSFEEGSKAPKAISVRIVDVIFSDIDLCIR